MVCLGIALAACATAPIDGVYRSEAGPSGPQREQRRYLVETGNGVWVVSREGAKLVPRKELPLVAPKKDEEPWRLKIEGGLAKMRDPRLEAALAKLKGRRVFAKLDVGGAVLDREKTLILDDGVYYRLQPGDAEGRSCGILVALAPASETFLTRELAALPIADAPSACPNALDRTRDNRAGQWFAVLRFHLGTDGQLEVVAAPGGYYVPVDTSPEDIARWIKSHGLDWQPPE